MDKTSVYLDAAVAARLRLLAKRNRHSQVEMVREAIAAYEAERPPDRHFAVEATFTGTYRGNRPSIADIADEELFEGFGE